MKRAALFVLLALPVVAEPFQHASLNKTVDLRRDARGIPYIKAADEHDLFFTQGYVTASDRLFQMELLRRTGRGELAEVFGKDLVDDDKRRRTYGFAQLAEAGVGKSSPEFEAALIAYADGVNAWIESHRDALPAEFATFKLTPRPWRPADSLIVAFLFAEDLSTTWNTDLAMAALADLPKEKFEFLFPTTSKLDLYVVGSGKSKRENYPPGGVVISDAAEPAPGVEASNNWVVAGSRTATGKPMLANDPHLAASAPSIWYITNLDSPAIHVAGVTTPGVPAIIIGHNDSIAWGCTNLGPDVQDLYRETFDGRRYKTPAGWSEATVRKETINVRDGEPVTVDVVITRHGPVIFESYALQWTALDATQNSAFDTFYRIGKAKNWTEFTAALRRYAGASQNFVYADRAGNIGWYAAGRIPIRTQGDGRVPLDGATSDAGWTKYIPFDELPHVYNPPSGIIVTANQRVAGPAYPHYLGSAFIAPYRARRIFDLLTAKPKLTIDDMRAVQADTYAYADAILAAEVVKMAKGKNDPAWIELLKTFGAWDGKANSESTAVPLAMAMRDAFRRRILTAALGAEKARRYRWPGANLVVDRLITERPAAWLPKEFTSYEALILATFADAKESLAKRGFADPAQWTLGRLTHYRFPHPIAKFSVEVPATSGGSSSPVNAAASVSMRFLADLSDWNHTRLGLALGESGDPASPHFKDQLGEWLRVEPGAFLWSDQ